MAYTNKKIKMLNIPIIPREQVEQIEWQNDYLEYDHQLRQLGQAHEEFLVINPIYEGTALLDTIDKIPPTPGLKCIVWKFNDNWVAKYFNKNWKLGMGYWAVDIKMMWERNPDIPDTIPFADDPSKIPFNNLYDLKYENIWYLDPTYNPTNDKVWVFRCRLPNYNVEGTKDMGYISPKVKIKYNKDLPDLTFDKNLSIPWYDLKYEHVWYLDPKFNPTDDKVWAVKVKLLDGNPKSTKDMGYVSPKLIWERNPAIPEDITLLNDPSKIPLNNLYDLKYEHVWYLDPKFNPTDDKVWVLRCHLDNSTILGTKDMGYISPKIKIKYNSDIPKIDFDFNLAIPWHELKYEHVWYLDPKFNPTDDKVWAIKVKLLNGMPKPVKDMGYVSPKIIYNPALPKLEYTIDDHIPYYDLSYEHVWMVDKKLSVTYQDVWAAKITPHEPKGTKIVGNAKFNLPVRLDVVFISYNEPNAETNWQKVLTKAPYAKRIDNIKGIVSAHKQAASIVKTDMFYVVDGDAELDDNWDFNFQPDIFDRDCVHVWRSINPVNGLKYGYGGVKLFPTDLVLSADENNTDMTTSLSDKFKLMPKISNTTSFNSDEFSAWRSAFRECAKLSSKIVNRQLSRETEKRLDIWCTAGDDKPFGKYAIAGAIAGRKFGKENIDNVKVLQLINDYDWLNTQFKNLYIESVLE